MSTTQKTVDRFDPKTGAYIVVAKDRALVEVVVADLLLQLGQAVEVVDNELLHVRQRAQVVPYDV